MAPLDTVAEELPARLAATHGAFCAEHPECGAEERRLALHLLACGLVGLAVNGRRRLH